MPTIQILVAGVDVTADVVFETAEFMSFVNGKPGEGYMRVRDLTSTRSFVTGSDWLVKIDGDAAWRGFVKSVLRVYIAPALNIAEQGLQRFIDLRGADLNLLFTERIVAKQSDPADVAGTQFPPGTDDTTAITELIDNWLDLSSDDLDTTSGVTHVGDLDPAQKTRAWSGGWMWGDAMNAIAMLPAAIYYLRPEASSPKGTLCYVDVDEPDAPFGLSDVPNGTTTKGYREMEIMLDGSSMANDVLGWGFGYGSSTPVFKRLTSTSSVGDHGLWQSSVIGNGVYKQATIDRMVDSVINGSPSSKRGAKNDRPYVRLVTYEPGLLAGHVVNFTSEVWGFTDAIPVRQMRISFEAPTDPRYEVTLSHEIDAPWGFIDSFWPVINVPNPCPNPPCFPVPPPHPPTPACDCGVTDSFTRTEAGGTHSSNSGSTSIDIGPSEAGPVYVSSLSNGGMSASVDGSSLVLTGTWDAGTNLHAGQAVFTLQAVAVMDHAATKTFKFSMASFPTNGAGFVLGIPGGAPSGTFIPCVFVNTGYVTVVDSRIGFSVTTSANSSAIPNTWWGVGVEYTVSLIDDGTDTTISITDGSTTYSHTKTGYTGETIDHPALSVGWATASPPSLDDSVTVTIDDFDIPEITRCVAVQFENFRRTDGSEWGAATPSGKAWTVSTSTNADASVDDVGTIALNSSAGSAQMVIETTASTGELWNNGSFDMVVPFETDNKANTGLLRFLFYEGTFATYRGLDLSVADDEVSVFNATGTETVSYSDWLDDERMMLHFQMQGGFIRLRVWLASAAEPSTWDVEFADPAGATPTFRVEADDNGLSSDTVILYASIDFNYAGRPCYYDCTGGYTDTFNRPDGPPGFADSGEEWFISHGAPHITSDHLVLEGTSSIFGYSQLYLDHFLDIGTTPIAGTFEFTPEGGSSTKKVLTTLSDFGSVELNWSASTVTSNREPSTDPPSDLTESFTFTIDAVHMVRYYEDYLVQRVKVWLASDPEPGSWLIENSGNDYTPDAPVYSSFGWINSSTDANAQVKNLLIEGDSGCSPVEPVAGGGSLPTGINGFGCELPTRSSSTVYTPSSSFQPNTTLVWRDGTLQRRGVDYTEDSGNHSITFADAVGSEVIRMCYFAEAGVT